MTAAVSISVVKGKDGGGGTTAQPITSGASQSPTASNSDIASANDTGPATIITEDPTCAAWTPIRSTVADAQSKAGWANHDYSIPATDWTPQLRETYSAVSKAMNAAADQTVTLVRKTPNRIMRELYEQFIAYSRQFGGLLNNYVVADNNVANVANNSFIAVGYVCDAITYKSAAARAPFVPDVAPPASMAKPGDPSDPKRFMTSPENDCAKWKSLFDNFNEDTKSWGDLDPNISATEWTPEQRATVDSVIPIMKKYADDVESLGRSSQNSTIVDFAVFSAQYWRAYVSALPSYARSDLYLTQVASRPPAIIVQACQALGA
ncbi:hypothetical protein [Mycolicibacterium brisbanense]|uniref:hypothetical protein n=1 Tax=Mycolicibacterium brisbanense TaxID=146020 RepID=UPI001F1DF11A|nr:hypothetical protein [Mycolicibacterium brisbanense]